MCRRPISSQPNSTSIIWVQCIISFAAPFTRSYNPPSPKGYDGSYNPPSPEGFDGSFNPPSPKGFTGSFNPPAPGSS
ncbi:hypothetical protein WJX73_006033 [Symbiochloris irregularis]|uniref:Uncharacterized protein n=1 Tax=Symbiochloris irregularis TaxID=706552 RepID=A0AAW1NJK8_9CHLO